MAPASPRTHSRCVNVHVFNLTEVWGGKNSSYPLSQVRKQDERELQARACRPRADAWQGPGLHTVRLRGVCVEGSWILLICFPKLWVSSARSRLLFGGLVDELHLKVIVSPAELIISYTSCFSPVSVLSTALCHSAFFSWQGPGHNPLVSRSPPPTSEICIHSSTMAPYSNLDG